MSADANLDVSETANVPDVAAHFSIGAAGALRDSPALGVAAGALCDSPTPGVAAVPAGTDMDVSETAYMHDVAAHFSIGAAAAVGDTPALGVAALPPDANMDVSETNHIPDAAAHFSIGTATVLGYSPVFDVTLTNPNADMDMPLTAGVSVETKLLRRTSRIGQDLVANEDDIDHATRERWTDDELKNLKRG